MAMPTPCPPLEDRSSRGRRPRVLFICKTILAPPSFGAATVNPFLGPGLGRKTLNAEDHTTWKVGVDLPIGPNLAGFKNDSLCGCCGHGAEHNLGSRRGIAGCCFNLIAKPARTRRSRQFGRAVSGLAGVFFSLAPDSPVLGVPASLGRQSVGCPLSAP